MARTTPGPPVDITAVFPVLDAYSRTAVRLHPRPGKPSMHDSHMGGPLIWPSDEPWPTCGRTVKVAAAPFRERGWLTMLDRVPESPIPMVGVAQFYARDIPEIPFPEGADLLQVLWCPGEHDMEDIGPGPAPMLVWRRADDLTDVLVEPPMRDDGAPAGDFGSESYLPRPCVLHPERVTEYPHADELPERLKVALKAWDGEFGYAYSFLLSIAPGCKIGGWESWHLTDMYALPCGVCGTETEPLLKVDSSEWDGGSDPRWRPMEERHLERGSTEYKESVRPTTLRLGRYAALTIFLCPRSADHGFRMTIQ
ncbi:hypothetical protein [Herbidospora sp. RD11066]